MSISRQSNIVAALMMRDIRTRFSRSYLGYFWAIAEPLAHFAWIVAVSYFVARQAPFGWSREVFVGSGILPLFIFVKVSTKVTSASSSLSGLGSLGVTTFDIAMAKSILESLTMILVLFIVMTALFHAGHQEAAPKRLDLLIAGLLVLFGLGLGFGFLNGAIARFFPMWKMVWGGIARGMIFLSGVVHILDFYPEGIRNVAYFIPTYHAITLTRMGFYGEVYPQLIFDELYLYGSCLVMLSVGLTMDRVTRHRIRRG